MIMARGKARTISERITIVSEALLKAKNKVVELQEEYESLLEEQRLEKASQILELANRTGLSTDEIEDIVNEYISRNSTVAVSEAE